MECIKCKAVIEDDSIYCRFCGKKQMAERRHKKRANGTGSIMKLSGNRQKPWAVKKGGVYIGTYSTRTEAQKVLERLTDQNINDKYNMTFAEVYEKWLAEHSRNITEKTRADYQWVYSICTDLYERKMNSILRSEYQAIIIKQEQIGRSKGTCNKIRTVLRQIGKWAMEEGITIGNNADGLSTAAKQLKVRKIFLSAEVEDIKKSKINAADIALILISCGCRPGELFKVPLADCFDDYIIGGSKTEAGDDRVMPIGPDGISAYRKIRKEAAESGGTLLIDGYNGSRVYNNFAKREWKKLMEEIGLPFEGEDAYTPYSCRHTFITNAIEGGMDLPTLEAIIGHVDRETTKLYTHLRADYLVEAVNNAKTERFAVGNKLETRQKSKISNAPEKLAK